MVIYSDRYKGDDSLSSQPIRKHHLFTHINVWIRTAEGTVKDTHNIIMTLQHRVTQENLTRLNKIDTWLRKQKTWLSKQLHDSGNRKRGKMRLPVVTGVFGSFNVSNSSAAWSWTHTLRGGGQGEGTCFRHRGSIVMMTIGSIYLVSCISRWLPPVLLRLHLLMTVLNISKYIKSAA